MAEIKLHEEENLLDIKNLVVHYETEDGIVEAVNNISLQVKRGESLGLVGETGAGKTTVCLSVMGLLPAPPAHVIQGEIRYNGENLLEMSQKKLRTIRGNEIGMIFQDPMTSLNPVYTVGDQITEVIRLHNHVSKAEAQVRAMKMLESVGIPADRFMEYPHQFSGGMKQRVVIAIALACNPQLLLADEPTTALDVTIQAQVLESIKALRRQLGTALVLVTHDLGIVADNCDKCAIVYAGEIVEYGTVEQFFDHPCHPYTVGLLGSIPSLESDVKRLKPIPGLMSDPMNLPPYCSFYDRCEKRCDRCKEGEPLLTDIGGGHLVKCKLFADKGETVADRQQKNAENA